MKYVKIIGFFAIIYLVYLGFSSFMDDSLEVAEKVNKIVKNQYVTPNALSKIGVQINQDG